MTKGAGDSSGKSNLSSCVADADTMMDMLVSSFGFDSGSDINSTHRCYVDCAVET